MTLRPAPLWVLAVGGAVLFVVTGLWVAVDTAIAPPTDSAHHLFNAISFARSLKLGGVGLLLEEARKFYVGWPPATYTLLYAPLGWALGDQTQLMRLYGLLLAPLLMWGTYRLAMTLVKDRKGATVAALLVVFCVGVAGQLRQVSLDLPAAAVVLLALLALVRSRALSSPPATLLFGAAVGLCLLTRVQSLFFISGPAAVAVMVGLWRAPSWSLRARRLGWMVLALALALLVSSPWWLNRLELLWYVSSSHLESGGRIAPRGDPRFVAGLSYYCASMGKLAGWTMLAAIAGTLPLLLWSGKGRDSPARWETLALVACVAGGLVGCSMGIHREPRYLLPAVPALVLLAVLGLGRLPRYRRLAAALLALSVIGPTLVIAAYPLKMRHWLVKRGYVEWAYVRHPAQTRWVLSARIVASLLRRGDPDGGRNTYVVFVQDTRVNFLPRMGSFLVPRVPEMAFSSQMSPQLANSPWHLRQRKKRRVFLLSEVETELDLPLVWEAKKHRYHNISTIRLYRVPAGHKLRGRVDSRAIFRWLKRRAKKHK